jgi:L,D-transpeptidase catalytic domain
MPGPAHSIQLGDVVVDMPPRGHRRLWLILAGIVVCLIGGALLGVRLRWPQARVDRDSSALARVHIAAIGEHIAHVDVLDASGRSVNVTVRPGGDVVPVGKLQPGVQLQVSATVRRAGWLGWLVGGKEHVHAAVRTPTTMVANRLIHLAAGHPVRVEFSSPVTTVALTTEPEPARLISFVTGRRSVAIGVLAARASAAGSVLVAGVARSWETLPAPVRVNWFQAGATADALVRPALKGSIGPTQAVVLTFSRTVADVLGTKRPHVRPSTSGSWRQTNAHTLVFSPSGVGFPLGAHVRVLLPRVIRVAGKRVHTLTWQVPQGSPVRLRQLLAQLGYLPLAFRSEGTAVPETAAAEARAAVDPPSGLFTWRYPHTPARLKALWLSSARATVLRGALLAFESVHHLALKAEPDEAVWKALLDDELGEKTAPNGYTYVFVTETLPQTLTLWQDGRVVLRTPVNTGILSRPTALGTYPVYLHLSSATMSGTNPDGSHYMDYGVPWVNYFNGGDAIHGFPRPGYGYPQSLGCVEVPIPTAGLIWPHVQVGTLVTVAA